MAVGLGVAVRKVNYHIRTDGGYASLNPPYGWYFQVGRWQREKTTKFPDYPKLFKR